MGFFSKIGLYIGGAVLILGLIFGGYEKWQSDIKKEALIEYNQKQLEQNIKDQQNLKTKLEDIATKQQQIVDQNNTDKQNLQQKVDQINDSLSAAPDKAAPAPQILKDTISKLKGLQ
jgi:peptidoglycan hydrolase CwlO-like protein